MTAEKFDFNQSFDTSSKKVELIKSDVVEKKIEEARTRAFTAGTEAGRSETLAEAESRTAAALERIAKAAETLFLNLPEIEGVARKEASILACAIAGKLSPALMRDRPLAEMEAMLNDCFEAAPDEKRIVIRTGEELIEPLARKIEGLKLKSASKVEVVLLGDPALGEFDCRIEWPDGGVERKYEQVKSEIDAAVKRYVTKSYEGAGGQTEDQDIQA